MPLVSIIIPVYNTKEYLSECIESVINQTVSDVEILLIDDGSTDGSTQICDSYSLQDFRIRVFHQNNSGVSSARNLGIREATGDWIMFVDSDDWIEKDAIEVLLKATEKEKCQLVFASGVRHTGNKTELILSEEILDCIFCTPKFRTDIFRACFSGCYCMRNIANNEVKALGLLIYPVMKLFQRDNIKDLFNENLSWGEDRLFCFNYCMASDTIMLVNYPMYHYRKRAGSATTTPQRKEDGYRCFAAMATPLVNEYTKNREIKKIWNCFMADNMFDLVRTYAMSSNNSEDIKRYSHRLSAICSQNDYSSAIKEVNIGELTGTNRRFSTWLLKKKRYLFLLLYMYIYFQIFPSKNQISFLTNFFQS